MKVLDHRDLATQMQTKVIIAMHTTFPFGM